MKLELAVKTLIAAAFGWAAISAAQDVRPVPGPGTGIVTVTGSVDISNMPPVRQGSDWQVRFASPPDVRLMPPEFVKPRGRLELTWPGGGSETVVVLEAGTGSWARVESSSRRPRWVNLAQAQAVEER